jgi:hypothetical protein
MIPKCGLMFVCLGRRQNNKYLPFKSQLLIHVPTLTLKILNFSMKCAHLLVVLQTSKQAELTPNFPKTLNQMNTLIET